MLPIGFIIIFGLIIICSLIFVVIAFCTHFYAIKLTKYIKKKDLIVWEEIRKRTDWVGIPLPAFLFQIDPASVPDRFDDAHRDDTVYLKLKKATQVARRWYFISFGFCVVLIVVGVVTLAVVY